MTINYENINTITEIYDYDSQQLSVKGIVFPKMCNSSEIRVLNRQDFSKALSSIFPCEKPKFPGFSLKKSLTNPDDFMITFNRLLELTEIDPDLDEEEECEILNPSDYAVSKSVKQLIDLYKLLGRSFPRGFSSLESRGGVNLIWTNQEFDKEVWVEIPFNSKIEESVYYRKGNDSELIKNPSLEEISDLLFWVSNQQPII
ncbi:MULTISPECIES: hypothetical protein [Planktothrix]|uniref:hypothetical protein n=1 Tax=Planktothrix TaxID=54304 RepID=UPI000425BEC0|nr:MULTISPECIES: hypothetical protein [Planktothrix]CAD5942617.1 hypothetical protein NO758_02009 [Planktothrix agardhii]